MPQLPAVGDDGSNDEGHGNYCDDAAIEKLDWLIDLNVRLNQPSTGPCQKLHLGV